MKFTPTSNLGETLSQNHNLLGSVTLQIVSAWVFSPCPTEPSYQYYQNYPCKVKWPPPPPNSSASSISFCTFPAESPPSLTPTYPLQLSYCSSNKYSITKNPEPPTVPSSLTPPQLVAVTIWGTCLCIVSCRAMDQTVLEMLNLSASTLEISNVFCYFPHFSSSEYWGQLHASFYTASIDVQTLNSSSVTQFPLAHSS